MFPHWIRAITAAVIILAAGPLAAAVPDSISADCRPPEADEWHAERAVSLKQLQIDLERCGAACPADLMELHGLGRVDGFVVTDGDIILIGPVRLPGQPMQHIDSLVIALRAAAHRYAETKGNVRYFTPPGLTLNPRPQTIAALNHAAQAKGTVATDRFCEACNDVQDLIVFGMPFDTIVTAVFALGDLTLKRISSSEQQIPIAGFESLAQKRRQAVEKALLAGRAVPGGSLNRFWFYPGLVSYRQQQAGGHGVVIERADVVIRQQRRVAAVDGRTRDGGPPDPLAAQWACEVTRLYPRIAEQAPESGFDGIARLLRVFAVAQLIVDRDAPVQSGLNLAYLFDRHPITPVPVKREWPGVAHVERVEYRSETRNRETIQVVNMPSCGGVDFSLDNANLKPVPDPDGRADAVGGQVIASRPSAAAAVWTVRAP